MVSMKSSADVTLLCFSRMLLRLSRKTLPLLLLALLAPLYRREGWLRLGRRRTHIRPAARARSVLVQQPTVDTARVEFVPAREHSHPIALLELGQAHSALFLAWTTRRRSARKALDDGLRRHQEG